MPPTQDTTAANDVASAEDAFDLVTGLWSGQLLYAAVELGLLESLADGPTSADDLARKQALDADATYRLLRALGYYDVVDEHGEHRFSLTSLGEWFLPDHPRSVRPDLRFVRSPEFVAAMHHLPDVVREGDPDGFVREFGRDFYEYAAAHPEFAERFNAFMTAKARRYTDAVLDALDVAGVEANSQVCDVGGGHGYLLARLLDRHPHLEGTVLDVPSVVAETDRLEAQSFGVDDRCEYVAGDMFESVPTADAYVLKEILHNWPDDDCVDVLSTIRDAAPSDARLYVVEGVIPGPDADHFAKRLDMTMLVHLGGRERTEAEFVALFERAGWEHVATYDVEETPASVLEATAA